MDIREFTEMIMGGARKHFIVYNIEELLSLKDMSLELSFCVQTGDKGDIRYARIETSIEPVTVFSINQDIPLEDDLIEIEIKVFLKDDLQYPELAWQGADAVVEPIAVHDEHRFISLTDDTHEYTLIYARILEDNDIIEDDSYSEIFSELLELLNSEHVSEYLARR